MSFTITFQQQDQEQELKDKVVDGHIDSITDLFFHWHAVIESGILNNNGKVHVNARISSKKFTITFQSDLNETYENIRIYANAILGKLQLSSTYNIGHITNIKEKPLWEGTQLMANAHEILAVFNRPSSVPVELKEVTHSGLLAALEDKEKPTNIQKALAALRITYKKLNSRHLEKALRRAATHESPELLQILLPHVNNIDAVNESTEEKKSNKNTAMHWAVMTKRLENIVYLARYGASINIKNLAGKTAIDLMLESTDPEIRNLVAISRKEFEKLTTHKINHSQEKIIPKEFIEQVYIAYTLIALILGSRRNKLLFCIKNGVTFCFYSSDKANTVASFQLPDNTIFINYHFLQHFPFYQLYRVLSHELEHASRYAINTHALKLTNRPEPDFISFYGHASPFFPMTTKQLLLVATLLEKGDRRITGIFLALIIKKATNKPLHDIEKNVLARYRKSCQTYRPNLIKYHLALDTFERFLSQGNLDVKTLNKRLAGNETVEVPLDLFEIVSTPFWINRIEFNNEEKSVRIWGHHAKNLKNSSERALALIYETFNRPYSRAPKKDDAHYVLAETHARIFGEMPEEVIRCFYNEMFQYEWNVLARYTKLTGNWEERGSHNILLQGLFGSRRPVTNRRQAHEKKGALSGSVRNEYASAQ